MIYKIGRVACVFKEKTLHKIQGSLFIACLIVYLHEEVEVGK